MWKGLLGFILAVIGIIWLGYALYKAWPPLLDIYLALIIAHSGAALIDLDDK